MRIAFVGMTHLGQTLARAADLKGFDVLRVDSSEIDVAGCELVFVTRDVDAQADVVVLGELMGRLIQVVPADVPVVVVSQVPPGFMRPWSFERALLFYQVDTLIMSCALERALHPERHIVGSADPSAALPGAYARYLLSFGVPVLRMSFEAAEFAKLAINFMLAVQVSAANALAAAAESIGARWDDVIPALQTDKRIGASSYLRPGIVGGHLPRDVRRIQALGNSAFANSVGPMQ